MAGSASLGLSAQQRGVRLAMRVLERAVGQRRPVGKPCGRPQGRPGFSSGAKESASLRGSCAMARTVVQRGCAKSEQCGAVKFAFSRHDGIYRSDGGLGIGKRRGRVAASRWSAPSPARRRDGSRAPRSSSAMSSGRLFLDRVARQQSPSALHRPPQTTTHSLGARAEGDISTLPGRRHFYFALTDTDSLLTRSHQSV